MTMHTPKNIRTIAFDGGCVCFDFVNTVSSRLDSPPVEYLREFEDVLILTERLGVLPAETLTELSAQAGRHPREAEKTLAHILRVRENLFRLFSAIATGQPVPIEALEAFNADLGMVFSHLQFADQGGRLNLVWKLDQSDLYLPLRLALRSAYQILTDQNPGRVKECPSCGWLFLDASKNNTRRWCDMQSCGSLDKAKRYYHRKKLKTDH